MKFTIYLGLLVACIVLTKAKKDKKDSYIVTEEVWFDVEIKDYDGQGEDYRGRFVVAVFGEVCPMTALNFISLAKGYKRGRKTLHYKNSPVHRVVRDFIIQMGDVTTGDGTGGKFIVNLFKIKRRVFCESIFGATFVDENFDVSHRARGFVSMANHGKDTNGSQFFILLTKSRWLDGKHVAFGKVIKGMDVIKAIGEVELQKDSAMPKKTVKIIDSGTVGIDKKYELTEEQIESEQDIEA
ncbi:hypothetical protein KUTeg_017523 [Tegillarca granosa]|uniref:Peptidyl-prolyl cis-trans isomerase n=1 Tax=Tegillarca granosa TaxID=220873 RepID=A0ABQ9EK84_TEGGR|nr:hypothetical protein KUTeg_017523 [Tegillarca granosa]